MKKTLFSRLAVLGALCLALVLSACQTALAADVPGFVVRAILPENQIEPQSYYVLHTPPQHRQTLEVEVTNSLPEPLVLQVDVTTATTGSQGVIIYEEGAPLDARHPALENYLSLDIEALESGEEEAILSLEDNQITIAPNATVRLPFALSLPEEELLGHVLGGIVLTKVHDGASETSEAFAVRSIYSYAIAVQLQSQPAPGVDASFDLTGARLESQAGFPALVAELKNTAARVVTGADFRIRLYADKDAAPLLDDIRQNVSMAPLSTMSYTLMLTGVPQLAPGEYTLQVELTYEGTTHTLETTLAVPV